MIRCRNKEAPLGRSLMRWFLSRTYLLLREMSRTSFLKHCFLRTWKVSLSLSHWQGGNFRLSHQKSSMIYQHNSLRITVFLPSVIGTIIIHSIIIASHCSTKLFIQQLSSCLKKKRQAHLFAGKCFWKIISLLKQKQEWTWCGARYFCYQVEEMKLKQKSQLRRCLIFKVWGITFYHSPWLISDMKAKKKKSETGKEYTQRPLMFVLAKHFSVHWNSL